MMVYNLTPILPDADKREILRYAGVRESNRETDALLEECLSLVKDITPRLCYSIFDLSLVKTKSATVLNAVNGCDSIVLFAATVGIGIDRLIAKHSALSPSRAVMLQAIGTERIEALCDSFSKSFRGAGRRVSPGYGDFPLDAQKEIFACLNCPKNIGVTLNESLLMSPTKSVTAIFGVKNENT